MSHSGMVQSAGSSGGPANNQGGRNTQPPSKYQQLPQGHQAQHVQPPSNHSVPPQHRANQQPPAPPQLRPSGPGGFQYSPRGLAQPDMKSGPGHVVNQGAHPHQAGVTMGHYSAMPLTVPPLPLHNNQPMIAQQRFLMTMRGQATGFNTGRMPTPQVSLPPNTSYVRPAMFPMPGSQGYPPNYFITQNAQMGQNMTPSPMMNPSQPAQNPPPKRQSKAIPIVNPHTGEEVMASQRKSSSGPPASATVMVHQPPIAGMAMPVAGAPMAGPPPPTNPVYVQGSPVMPLPTPVMEQEQPPKAPIPSQETVMVDVATKRENTSSRHSPAPQIGANAGPPAAAVVTSAPAPPPPAPETAVEPVKELPAAVSAPVTSGKVESNSTKSVPSAADEDEERRKVEERNEENLRKSQEATKHDSSQSTPVQENSAAPDAPVPDAGDAAAPAAPAREEPKPVVEDVKPPVEEPREEVAEPSKEAAPQSPPAPAVTAAGEMKNVEPPVPSSPEAVSDTTLEEGEVVSDEGEPEPAATGPGHMYKPGQWSPSCPDGKKQYDREFLLKLQSRPLSMNPPSEMPVLDIFKETSHRHTLPPTPGLSHASASLDGYTQRNGQRPGVGPMHRNKQSQMRNASDRQAKRIITLSSSMNEDVKLHVAENAWKPVKEQNADSDAALYKKFRGILNKLTPQKFAALLDQVKQLEINTEERLSNVTNLVLEKALNETHFASTYAKLCQTLLTEFTITKKDPDTSASQTVSFRKMLLQKCQQEFERDTDDSEASRKREKAQEEERKKQLESCENEQQRKELKESFAERDLKAKRRTLGLMRFIGELYNLTILNFNIMHDCFLKLLKNPTDEDSIVCACKLFTTVGKKLNEDIKNCTKEPDKSKMKEKYDDLMLKLKRIINENREAQKNNGVHLPQRVIFMLEDVWELKSRSWVPRRDEQAPKTLDQIQKEAENEKILANLPQGPPGGGGSGGNARYNSMPNDRNRRGYGNQSQGSGQGTTFKQTSVLMAQIKLPTATTPFGASRNWVAGASGGGSRNSSLRGSSRLDNNDSSPNMNSTNKFELLNTDASDHPVRSQESSPSRAHDRERVRDREAAIQGARTLSHHGNNRPQSGPRSSAPTSRTPSLSGPTAPGTTYSLLGENVDDEERVERFAKTILDEYVVNKNKEDFLRDFCDQVHKENLEQFIVTFVKMVFGKPKNLPELAEAVRELHTARILSIRNFENILKTLCANAADLMLDYPKFYEHMADLVSRLVDEMDWISLIRVICDSLGKNSPKVMLPFFKNIKAAGGNGVVAKWKKSGLSIPELVNGASESDIKLLEEALADLGAASPGGAKSDMTVAELTKKFETAFAIEDAQARDAMLEEIIQKAGKDHRIMAVRACATAILQLGMVESKNHFDRKFVMDRFQDAIPGPIKDLFTEELSIHALYALQVVSHELRHPKDLTSNFLNFIYDNDLVDDTTILMWGDKTRTDIKHEPVGYHMTVQLASGFLGWLQDTPDPNH